MKSGPLERKFEIDVFVVAVEKDKLEPQSICRNVSYHSRNIFTCTVTGPHMNRGVGLGMQVFSSYQFTGSKLLTDLKNFCVKLMTVFYITS